MPDHFFCFFLALVALPRTRRPLVVLWLIEFVYAICLASGMRSPAASIALADTAGGMPDLVSLYHCTDLCESGLIVWAAQLLR